MKRFLALVLGATVLVLLPSSTASAQSGPRLEIIP